MNAKAGMAIAMLLAACSQQEQLVEERIVPAQEIVLAEEKALPPVQPCLVANAGECLAMDERPFAFCALGAERCPGETEFEYVKP